VIRTKPSRTAAKCDDNVSRCGEIADALRNLHDSFDFIFIASEAQSWTRHANADRAVAQAWGVIAALSELFNCPVIQIRPQEIKMAITGARSASKESVQNILEYRVGNAEAALSKLAKTQQNHASDALAAAVASLRHPLVQTVKRLRG